VEVELDAGGVVPEGEGDDGSDGSVAGVGEVGEGAGFRDGVGRAITTDRARSPK
jgi:hypothetical protein